MYETTAALRDLLKWIFQSWWRAAIAGFLIGVTVTGFAYLFDLALGRSAFSNLTLLMLFLVTSPAEFVLGFNDFDRTASYQQLLTRFGAAVPILVNGILLSVAVAILVLPSTGVRKIMKRSMKTSNLPNLLCATVVAFISICVTFAQEARWVHV